MSDLEQILIIWLIGFVVGYFSKKSTFNITINLKKDGTSNEL